MDSLTQAALGAAVFTPFYLRLAKSKHGRQSPTEKRPSVALKGTLFGAILGTLPDLDVFIPYADPVTAFVSHRGPSHSLIIHLIVAPLLAIALHFVDQKWQSKTSDRGLNASLLSAQHSFWILSLGIFLTLATHALLDAFTVYGTQIFWPFATPPASWSTIFIIDPLYTLPLILAVIAGLRRSQNSHTMSYKPYIWGLGISSLYLLWTLVAKTRVEERLAYHLREQGVSYRALLTTPSPFNTILWRAVILVEGGYLETYYSLAAPESMRPKFDFHDSQEHWLSTLENQLPVEQLRWFTHGFYQVRLEQEQVVMTDIRMGSEPHYIFSFGLGPPGGVSPPQRLGVRPDLRDLQSLFSRLTTH